MMPWPGGSYLTSKRKETVTEIAFCEALMVHLGERTLLEGRLGDTFLYLLFTLLYFLLFLMSFL